MFLAHRRKEDGAEQSIADHLRGVSCWAGRHASKIGLRQAGELVGLLHDLGKYSNAFQSYLKSAAGLLDPDADGYTDFVSVKGKIDHSTAGAQYIWRRLSNGAGMAPYVGQILALCIASHHSGLIDCISADSESFGEDKFTRRMEKERTYLEEAVESAEEEILGKAMDLLDDPNLVEDVRTLSRRIAKSNNGLPIAVQQQFGLVVRFLFSCLLDGDRSDTADFESKRAEASRQRGIYRDWRTLTDRLETHLSKLLSRQRIDFLRCEVSEHCRDAADRGAGVYTLTVPTGGGKTLASLRFALHHAQNRKLDRVIYVVPFTSIIDQNADVVRNILEVGEDRGMVVLEHHSNLTPEVQTLREKILCENWDSPVVYTTMVQFLEALFGSGTRGARRMHQLANSVLIFDEVQSLPIKCVHLFNNAINFLVEQCNCTAVLCTATQPLLHQVNERGAVRMSPQAEIMPDRQRLFDELKRVEVIDRRRPGGWSYDAIAQLAVEEERRVGSCLVVVNTKEAARRVYENCHEVDGSERVHLSTHMCPAHRRERLAYIRARLTAGLPIICVSTQLIEAGVDVDFGAAIRSLAGLDSIAQTAGRCNRNGRLTVGRLHVVDASEENLTNLPEIRVACRSAQRVLDDFRENSERYGHNMFGPGAMEDYYRYYFFERREEMSYPVVLADGRKDTVLGMLSDNGNAISDYRRVHKQNPRIHFTQAFMTAAKAFRAIDVPTRGVIVPYGKEGQEVIGELCSAYAIEKQYELLRKAQQFTVNVFPHVLQELVENRAVRRVQENVEILYLDERYYSEEFGMSTEQVTEMRTYIV